MFRYLVGPGFDFGLPRAQWDSTMSPNPVGNTGVLQFSGVSQPLFLGAPYRPGFYQQTDLTLSVA